MAFSRKFLIDNGVPEDKVDVIMAERNRTLTDYVPKADVQAQIDAALQAHKPDPIDPTTTDAYKQLAQERDMLRAIGGDDFQTVKPKFREQVYGMLKREDGAPGIPEQLAEIKKGFGTRHMKERIEMLQGTVTFDGSDGFTVTARIPIRWSETYD